MFVRDSANHIFTSAVLCILQNDFFFFFIVLFLKNEDEWENPTHMSPMYCYLKPLKWIANQMRLQFWLMCDLCTRRIHIGVSVTNPIRLLYRHVKFNSLFNSATNEKHFLHITKHKIENALNRWMLLSDEQMKSKHSTKDCWDL